MTTVPTRRFHDDHAIPQLGYGLFKVDPEVAADVTGQALRTGYRHIDTATYYANEEGVGQAIHDSGIPRDELFITTKLWDDAHEFEAALQACEDSLARLGLEYLDLYLIHWAVPEQRKYVDAWRALIELRRRGRVRSIGVSNFPGPQLEEIIEATGVAPVIHQVELHPYFQQRELRDLHARHGIVTEAWGPLGQGKSDQLDNEVITRVAAAHDATPAQVIIAWHLAIGNVVIPKSVTSSRITENFEATRLQLSDGEIEVIDGLDRADGRGGADPALRPAPAP